MTRWNQARTVLVCGVIAMVPSFATATPIVIPPGLTVGSTYFLAFTTADTHNALSSNIADYDAFVTAEANTDPLVAALGTTWKVIGSTDTVNAVDHVGVIMSLIYNLLGFEVATGSAQLFSGGPLLGAINSTQDGLLALPGPSVYTGSTVNGTAYPGWALGDSSHVIAGDPLHFDPTWINDGGGDVPVTPHSFYAISGPLTVTSPVPEPGTLVLLGTGLVAASRWRKRRPVA